MFRQLLCGIELRAPREKRRLLTEHVGRLGLQNEAHDNSKTELGVT